MAPASSAATASRETADLTASRAALGVQGEDLVAGHLERQGFAIVGRNLRAGRYELDLLAVRDRLLVICEVRTRASRAQIDPIESIDRKKRERVRKAAAIWLPTSGYEEHELRFDAASVVINASEQTIAYYADAF
ncbi:MAG TPA: YraN family protein [Polyangiales bacterium]|nr:YraN family protein [Polyangiales bacterium]